MLATPRVSRAASAGRYVATPSLPAPAECGFHAGSLGSIPEVGLGPNLPLSRPRRGAGALVKRHRGAGHLEVCFRAQPWARRPLHSSGEGGQWA